MSDNKQKIGNPDRQRVNMSEKYEVENWTRKFGVSREELQKAVDKVGNESKDLEEFFKSKR